MTKEDLYALAERRAQVDEARWYAEEAIKYAKSFEGSDQ